MKTKKGDKQFTSTVYIFSDEKPKRALLVHHIKYDKWMPPGGHIESDENPIQTAIREVKEETGLDISVYLPKAKEFKDKALSLPLPKWLIEVKIKPYKDEPEHYHIDTVYVVTVPHQIGQHRKEESHDIGWFTLKELDNLSLFGNVREQLNELLTS